MAGKDDIKTSSLALVGALGTLVVVAIILLLQVLYYGTAGGGVSQREFIQPPTAEMREALRTQQENLAQYRWLSQKDGIAAIPVQRAMELVVRDVASGKTGVFAPPPESPQKPVPGKEEGHAKVK